MASGELEKNKAAFREAVGACVCMRVCAATLPHFQGQAGFSAYCSPRCRGLLCQAQVPASGSFSVVFTSSRAQVCLHAVLLELILSSGSPGPGV